MGTLINYYILVILCLNQLVGNRIFAASQASLYEHCIRSPQPCFARRLGDPGRRVRMRDSRVNAWGFFPCFSVDSVAIIAVIIGLKWQRCTGRGCKQQ